MSWIRNNSMTWMQRFCGQVLTYGPIPKHVAFIMDGNRRYARKNNVEKCEGHSRGFDKLSETLQWCLYLGVKEVTVYAFSLDNFKRTQEEIDTLFNLAREKFKRLLQEKDKLNKHGVCINVIGNLTKLPADLTKLIAESMYITRHNNNALLNVAFCYTGHDELTNTFNQIVNGVKKKYLDVSDVNVDIIDKCLYTYPSPPPDLLIRTSGETRLSDFMIWQCSYSYMYFTPVLWPDFTAWDFLAAIFMYQRNAHLFEHYNLPNSMSLKAEDFVKNLREKRLNRLYTVI
ncbi:dehydrodolichyl diphosphate synthase complex subunit DHDDS [Daktulosphaira vitifoliae]|uniref:dehydrodolichyl diphosphate synthase complex subunit DHDDS n=1 Tax=Daktulosphaira vitifoliae TaxID=58002 RepID=UPI0021AAF97F|nr:dehydrodolichyl diphosphate synthase complex subunit DHDDS [Daktulosphaira vitifoliae]XP_050534026.1 dehydrodolichyl diphosphate synthase complex subunit DHDDS [Daktulosphaira vitifoliae]